VRSQLKTEDYFTVFHVSNATIYVTVLHVSDETKYVTVYHDSNGTNLSYYCWCSVSPLSFCHATDSHDTLMLSCNLSLFLVLVGGNAVGQ
jgi:hypothetical protein